MAGAAILALLLGTPQVQAEDDIVIFGGEFEDEATPETKKPKPVKELPPPKSESKPEAPKPDVKPTPKPEVQKPEVKPQPKPEVKKPDVKPSDTPQDIFPLEDDDDLGDVLIFDDVSNLPKPEPKPLPAQIDEPAPTPAEVEQPFAAPEPQPVVLPEPVEVVPPTPIQPQPVLPEPEPLTPPQERITLPRDEPINQPRRTTQAQPTQPLKTLKQRFVKLAVDDTYTYYLDKTSVQWKRMPYSASEYIADVWIRMVERKPAALDDDMASYGEENFNAEISLAHEQGYQYSSEDVKVLSSQAYVLEHYYLRPKTKQVQFLCELEVFGRPQNTINERAYDYKNWESLVPGSVESAIYNATIKIIGTRRASEKGHMTFVDMLDEYARIALN